jgi:hypothetical protein
MLDEISASHVKGWVGEVLERGKGEKGRRRPPALPLFPDASAPLVPAPQLLFSFSPFLLFVAGREGG